MNTTKTTLIVGGTGKTGRRVAQRLVERGLPVRIGSRTAPIPFDWERAETFAPCLADVGAVYLTYYPDLAIPGAAESLGRFADVAATAGAQKIVLLSGRGEPKARTAEERVRRAGLPTTVLRSAFFCQNFSEGELRDAVLAGKLAFPAGDVTEPFIDVADLADVAVAALTSSSHDGMTYELTGPALVGFAEAARVLSKAMGRPVTYVPLTKAEFVASFDPRVPADYVAFLAELFTEVLDGHNAYLTDDVARVLGRSPRSLAEWAEAAARDGAWGPR